MRIGIVTISYNQASYLTEAIESVQVADIERLEYVMVDPGSTDGSRDIIERFRRRFSRIILEPDKGPPDGLNKGFAATTADVVGYLNADDRFTPGALDYVVRYFERRPDVDVLCGAIRIIDENGEASIRRRTPDRIDLRSYAYETCFFWQQATFFRREAFLKTGGFNVQSKTAWDGELVVDMALAGCRFAYTNKLLGDFRIYGDSITGSGRFAEALRSDRAHMREKILRAGIQRASGFEVRAMKAFYKFNLRRHWSYFFGGEELERTG
ncbi:MAG TPA: glycosyltransferase family 2 protein [Bryobacteraceae bacterium]|nr:glycosyltransferase family 2 protein [Bryobacteraceae bacterium]